MARGQDTFLSAGRSFFTSESVTEGHPDKVCDQISDAVLDAVLRDDPNAKVACETATTTGMILVFGEITTETYVDIPALVRDVVRDIGYTHSSHGFDANTCGVMVAIKEQSTEISEGVNAAIEVRQGRRVDAFDQLGAGDQGMMIGFACNETPELMPLPISLAHAIARRLTEARKSGELPYLRPDGKSQVTVEYFNGKPVRVDTVVVSAQHAEDVDQATLAADIRAKVVDRVVPASLLDDETRYLINPSGRFVLGGPMADAGLTRHSSAIQTRLKNS